MTKPRVPHELTRTNLAGVFAAPATEQIDHLAANRLQLIRQGILLKRPDDHAPEAFRAAWARAFAQPWPADRRIVPHSVPHPGITHPLGAAGTALRPTAETTDGTTATWAGGVVLGPWTSAVGIWQVPTVSRSGVESTHDGEWNDSSWVGIDGSGSNDVLQAGVAQSVTATGVTRAYAWYEWFAPEVADSPDYIHETEISNLDVQPGDTVFVAVQYAGTLPPPATGAVTGYESAYNDQLHVDYLSTDGHVHELVYLGSWQHNDLMQLIPSAPPAATGSPLLGYVTNFDIDLQHVIYLDGDGHIHELVYDSGWQHNDLMVVCPDNPTPAWPGGPLHAYLSTYNDQQHINYLDKYGHVHELYEDHGWHHLDLFIEADSSPPEASLSSHLTGYTTDNGGDQQHINYLTKEGHVQELVFRDRRWYHDDLFALCPELPPPAVDGSPLTGYVTAFFGNWQQHVNYVDANGHPQELVHTDRWNHNDLTGLSGAEDVRKDGPMVGYLTAWNNQQHVSYIGVDDFIHEIVYRYAGNQWTPVDISDSAGWIEPAGAVSPLAAWTSHLTHPYPKQHLIYVDADGHVHEMYYVDDGHWIHNDLSKHATMTGVIYMGNARTQQHCVITMTPPPSATFSGNTAEWIVETPEFSEWIFGDDIATLPRFTELTFTAAVCCGPGHLGDASDGVTQEVAENGAPVTNTILGPATVKISYIGP